MRRARRAGHTLWISRGDGSVLAGERFGSWPYTWSGLAVYGSKPVMHLVSGISAWLSQVDSCGCAGPSTAGGQRKFRFNEVVIRKSELSACLVGQITGTAPPSPRLHEGTLRGRHGTLARVAMDAAASGGLARRAKRSQRTAKSCGPDAATVASIPAGLCWRGNGDKKGRSPGSNCVDVRPVIGWPQGWRKRATACGG